LTKRCALGAYSVKSVTTLFNLISIAALVALSQFASANENYAEQYGDDNYQEETYQDESYPEEAYPEETYQEQSYTEETYQEPPYREEPEMDSSQAAHVKEVKALCQQWAQESGLEDEDKSAYIEDCVYSQTGF